MSKPHGPSLKAIANGPRVARPDAPRAPLRTRSVPTPERASAVERKILAKLGVDAEVLDSGCCGMAGSFGFEEGKYEVSQKAGERVLLPKMRDAPQDAVIVSDGFSCKTQVEQNSDRKALHVAELIKLGLEFGPRGPLDGGLPENALPGTGGAKALVRFRRRVALSAGAVTAALLGGFTWRKLVQG